MRAFKSVMLAGTAVLALSACSSNRGPGEIGSRDDIIIRNMGDEKAPPPAPVSAPEISRIEEAAPAEETASDMAAETAPDFVPAPPDESAAQMTEQEEPPAGEVEDSVEDDVDVREQVIPREPEPDVVPEESSEAAGPMGTVEMRAPSPVAGASDPASPVPAAPPENVPDAPDLVDLSEVDMAVLPTKTPQEIMDVQEALKEQGFYEGAPDGKVDAKTLNSLMRYKASKGALPAGNKPLPAPLPVSQETQEAVEEPPVAAAPTASRPVAASMPTVFKAGAVRMNDPALIRAAQTALTAKGFYDGSVTGEMDTALLNALSRYQSANLLAPGGLNEETLKSLGVME
ncbi:MAG: peptidoglycan-binding protein [Rhodospirillales bacterium]|nr:peptidoglycan-binding protein [Alphaproteobacteria bacterium]USO03556.1 MAG: peptidoglycan-binding protein [Rhodospirillales bacterium]